MRYQFENRMKVRLAIGAIGLAVAASGAGQVPAPPAAIQPTEGGARGAQGGMAWPRVGPETTPLILFVGNSLTYGANSSVMFYRPETVHDLNPPDFANTGMRAGLREGRTIGGVPALFKAMTREAGLNYDVSVETVGGMGLDYHLAERRPVIDRPWDIVVAQQNSGLNAPVLIAATKKMADMLVAKNPQVKFYLFATWSVPAFTKDKDSPWFGKPVQQMGKDVQAANEQAARESGRVAGVVPVGLAWNNAIDTGIADDYSGRDAGTGKMMLWATDGHHGSFYGYYLEALMHFGMVTKRDPQSLGADDNVAQDLGINERQAAALQKVAHDTLAAQGVIALASCADLTHLPATLLGDDTASIETARVVEAGPGPADPRPGAPPAALLPQHCELFGKLQEHAGANGQTYAIRFHMRLPTAWNERFFFQGGGGSNGVIGSATGNLMGAQSQTALGLGYAVVSQDSGHDNATNNDPKLQGTATFGWDPEARRNHGFASIGAVTTAAKAVIRSYYGRAPKYSYFVGGSKGGQEAFMASQRFGREFDGVLAGYPGFRLATAGSAGEMWDSQAFAAVSRKAGALGADGLPLLNRSFTDDDLALVSGAVLEACDALDGLKDGMVLAFTQCTTRRVLPNLKRITCAAAKNDACISVAQIDALVRVFDGARDRSGRLLYATWPWDAGIGGRAPGGYFRGWRTWKIGNYDAAVNNAANVMLGANTVSSVFTSPPTPVAANPTALTQYALGLDVTATEAASHLKWGPHNESSVDFMNAVATDLTPFTSHGGKLLIYHGVSDPVFSINDTISWLNAVNRFEKGKASRFVRLFAVPGMNHGGGGPATDQADFFSALVNWTEHGTAPVSFVATARTGTNWPGRTRLLCAYPKVGRYLSGDAEKASSFTCR